MASKLSPYWCVFRKNHVSQHSLLKIIEVWKKNAWAKEDLTGVILMNLSKTFDTTNILKLAKLQAYWFSLTSFKFMQIYLCKRFPITTINGSFSNWTEIMTGVLRGSILGTLLFRIFLNDKFPFYSKQQTLQLRWQ